MRYGKERRRRGEEGKEEKAWIEPLCTIQPQISQAKPNHADSIHSKPIHEPKLSQAKLSSYANVPFCQDRLCHLMPLTMPRQAGHVMKEILVYFLIWPFVQLKWILLIGAKFFPYESNNHILDGNLTEWFACKKDHKKVLNLWKISELWFTYNIILFDLCFWY